jgi:hypothetical protein
MKEPPNSSAVAICRTALPEPATAEYPIKSPVNAACRERHDDLAEISMKQSDRLGQVARLS